MLIASTNPLKVFLIHITMNVLGLDGIQPRKPHLTPGGANKIAIGRRRLGKAVCDAIN